jgi:hypothetical protein
VSAKKARVLCFICGVNISNTASACAVLNFSYPEWAGLKTKPHSSNQRPD